MIKRNLINNYLEPNTGVTVIESLPNLVYRALPRALRVKGANVRIVDSLNPQSVIINFIEGGDYQFVAELNRDLIMLFHTEGHNPYYIEMANVVLQQVILLLKHTYHNDFTYFDIYNCLMNSKELHNLVERLRGGIPEGESKQSDRRNLLFWFDKLYFGESREKFHNDTISAKTALHNLVNNPYFQKAFMGQSTFSIEEHLKTNGFLGVVTNEHISKELSGMISYYVLRSLRYHSQSVSSAKPHAVVFQNTTRYSCEKIKEEEELLQVYPSFEIKVLSNSRDKMTISNNNHPLNGRTIYEPVKKPDDQITIIDVETTTPIDEKPISWGLMPLTILENLQKSTVIAGPNKQSDAY